MTVAEQIAAEQVLGHTLEQYGGQWVAIRQHELVASAPSLDKLLVKVQDQLQEVEVFEVAEDPNAACFF